MKCRELLEPGAAACVECGTKLGQPIDAANGTSTQSSPLIAAIPVNRNTLSYNEDRNSRRFEASLTDSAIHGLGDVLGGFFAQRGVGRSTPPGGVRTIVSDTIIDETKQLPASVVGVPEQHEPQAAPSMNAALTGNSERDRLLKVFALEGELLELADNRLKAKNASDYYKRLTYLFIYAQEILLGRSSTPRTELATVLKAAKVYDSNCRAWLGQRKGFTVDAEDRLKLITGAKEQAVKTLDEALDTSIEDVWNPDTRTVKARKKKA